MLEARAGWWPTPAVVLPNRECVPAFTGAPRPLSSWISSPPSDWGMTRCRPSPSVAAQLQRGVRILADYLTIQGFLTKEGDRCKLTPDSQVFLDRRSPAYMGSVLRFCMRRSSSLPFDNLTEAVRKGRNRGGRRRRYAGASALGRFPARLMIPMMVKPGGGNRHLRATVAAERKGIDVAAGHGLFGIEIAARCPEAEVTALDWPNVLTAARELARSPASSRAITRWAMHSSGIWGPATISSCHEFSIIFPR